MHRPSIDPASKVVGKGPDGLMSIGTKSPGRSSSASGTSVANVGALTTDLQAISQQRVLIYNSLTALQSWSYLCSQQDHATTVDSEFPDADQQARTATIPAPIYSTWRFTLYLIEYLPRSNLMLAKHVNSRSINEIDRHEDPSTERATPLGGSLG